MALPQTVPYLGWSWDDLVFLVLAGVLLGSSLMVVLSRNIIRSGLFMILAFLGLAGIYALMGATIVAAAQVLIYIGAISVLILFAVMLTQSKSGPAATGLPSPGVGRRHRVGRRGPAAHHERGVHHLAAGDAGAHRAERPRRGDAAVQRLRPGVRGHQPAAARGRHRRHLPRPARHHPRPVRPGHALGRRHAAHGGAGMEAS